jgi:predicted nucleic acid-binding protein
MRIFRDINVIIDVPLQRPGWLASEQVLRLCSLPVNSGFVAWHSVATIHYLLAKSFDRASANSFLSDLLDQVDVGPASTLLARRALSLGLRDTEDALQVAVAESLAADVIVTRNGRDFVGAPVLAQTPEDFLSSLAPP